MNKRIYFAIGILSASIIAFQLSLMQMLTIVQWNHFAYMVISVALLGFGASGTLLVFAKKWLIRHAYWVTVVLMFLTSLSMCGVLLISSSSSGRFDSFLLFVDPSHILRLIALYFVFFIPFFFGAMAIGLTYISYVNKIGGLYFSDMTGSGIGGLAILGLLWIFEPSRLPAVIAFIPLVAGTILLPVSTLKRFFVLIALLFALPLFFIISPPDLQLSQYKSLSKTLNIPGSEVIIRKKSPYGLIQVLQCPALRYAPGLSLAFTGEVPVRDAVFVNGDWFGPVMQESEHNSVHFLNYSTYNLPFVISTYSNVLVPDGGTGLFASHALSHNARKITLVEENTVATDLLKNELAGRNDSLFSKPEISLVNLHSRSYLLSDSSLYDLIILPTIESFGGSSGIYALKEQFIFTSEALESIWDRTKADGVIAVTSWIDYPLRNPLKMLATLTELLDNKGITEIKEHIAIIKSWGTISFILKKSALTKDDTRKIREFCAKMYFDPVLLPDIEQSERSAYNHFQDENFFTYIDRLVSDEREEFYNSYDFNIKPATDNKPYFSQFIKLSGFRNIKNLYGEGMVAFLEIGYFIILFTFIQITLAAMILIILPLFFTSWKGGGKGFTFLYFSGIGLGFMFVEIILIQQFILYFGNPIYAASAVLSGMLIFTGAGSLMSSRLRNTSRISSVALLLVILFILIYSLFLTPILRATINANFLMKVFFSFIFIAPAAFFMGLPFPLGLRFLSEKNNNLIPWAWGINGCFSVISTVLATIIAVEAGFFLVMVLAGLAYTLALFANLSR